MEPWQHPIMQKGLGWLDLAIKGGVISSARTACFISQNGFYVDILSNIIIFYLHSLVF